MSLCVQTRLWQKEKTSKYSFKFIHMIEFQDRLSILHLHNRLILGFGNCLSALWLCWLGQKRRRPCWYGRVFFYCILSCRERRHGFSLPSHWYWWYANTTMTSLTIISYIENLKNSTFSFEGADVALIELSTFKTSPNYKISKWWILCIFLINFLFSFM